MALRRIRTTEDPVLRKTSRPVEKINDRIIQLIEDMIETMEDAEGVGLAAPQVGVLRRVVVIDLGDGPIVMINPEITHSKGTQLAFEACLSIPDTSEKVERPFEVEVKYMDLKGKAQTLKGEELLARAICHELDHLEGILFIDKVKEQEN